MTTIIENRRNLHQIPEIELTTQKTAQYIENVLDLYDCIIDHPIQNSVTAYFDNQKEKTIVFRSDGRKYRPRIQKHQWMYARLRARRPYGHGFRISEICQGKRLQRIIVISARRRKTWWRQTYH